MRVRPYKFLRSYGWRFVAFVSVRVVVFLSAARRMFYVFATWFLLSCASPSRDRRCFSRLIRRRRTTGVCVCVRARPRFVTFNTFTRSFFSQTTEELRTIKKKKTKNSKKPARPWPWLTRRRMNNFYSNVLSCHAK